MALSNEAAQSCWGRADCIAVIRSTPRPRGAPYHSPKMAPASAAGAASLSPSAIDGHAAGSCTNHMRWKRLAPRTEATSWAAAGAALRPTVVEMKMKKNTAIAATAVGPRLLPRMMMRHGATATQGAALAIAASLVMLRRRNGTPAARRAATNASVPPMTRPRNADHVVAATARRYTPLDSPKIGSTASAGVTNMPLAQPARPP